MGFWPVVFWAAAVYNLVFGLPGLLRRDGAVEGRIVGLLVSCFGLVYALVALDPVRFGPVLWAGVLGKLGVIALLGPAVMRGLAPRALGYVLAGDAAFTAAFLVYLLG